MNLVVRALAALLAVLLSALSLSSSAVVTASLATAQLNCTYDGHCPSAEPSATTSDRGPPQDRFNTTGHYNPTAVEQLVTAGSTTQAPMEDAGDSLVSFERDGVAANTAAKACSFDGATTVLMADGTRKPIEDVKVGDKVIATDPETGEQNAKKVTRVWVHQDELTKLEIDGQSITTTEDQPFWSVDDGRFERADTLAPGESVLTADGRTVKVGGLRRSSAYNGTAYNLSVEGIHTYHVGDDEVLVHNACYDLDELSQAGQVMERNGLTGAGRAAQKHGNRPGGFGLPPTKNPAGYNQYGQDMLDEMLTAPNTATRSYSHPSYGQVTEFLGPNYGARFDSLGNFMGFL